MAYLDKSGDWILVPSTAEEIDAVRKKCQTLVMRRAAISAGMAAVPIPGIDIATDIGMLASLINDINTEFGLTPVQIDRLQPRLRLLAYEMIVGMGSVMIGKVVTRELVTRLLQRAGMKIMLKYSAKIVPIAGQMVSAAIGFVAFRTIGYQHINACAEVAAELLVLRAKSVST
jgi:hypothetical protein